MAHSVHNVTSVCTLKESECTAISIMLFVLNPTAITYFYFCEMTVISGLADAEMAETSQHHRRFFHTSHSERTQASVDYKQ